MSAHRNDLQSLIDLEQGALRCPHKVYRAELDEAPVRWAPQLDSFVVFGAPEISEVLQDAATFSSSIARGRGAMVVEDLVRARAIASPDMADLVAVGYGSHPDVRAGSTADPPRHTAQKRLVQQAFSARRVRGYESIVREIVRDVVDDVSARAAHGPVDLVEHFAAPIPIRILAAVLGVESSDIPDYVRWSVGLLKPVGRTSVDPDELDEMVQCRKEFDRYFVDILRDRMAEPRDDFMTDFVHGASDGDDPLSIDEMLAIIEQSVIAGHETSTKLIASILLLLSENPQVHERVRDNPDALDAMIDETLRLESPAQMVHRLAVHDVTLGGVEIPAGSAVSLVLGSGNRDPRTMSSPDAIDLERTERRGHFGFGMGAHFCVGRILARLEVSTALSELIDHFDVSMVPGTTREDLHYMPTFAMHGISKLPMQVTPRDRAPENG